MPNIYNITGFGNSTDLFGVTTQVNLASGGVLGTMLVLMVAVISFLVLKGRSTKVALLGSSFLTALVTILIFSMGWVGTYTVTVAIILCAGAFVAGIVYRGY
jgi:hypothetical protein